jgi:hypothetical protein
MWGDLTLSCDVKNMSFNILTYSPFVIIFLSHVMANKACRENSVVK